MITIHPSIPFLADCQRYSEWHSTIDRALNAFFLESFRLGWPLRRKTCSFGCIDQGLINASENPELCNYVGANCGEYLENSIQD